MKKTYCKLVRDRIPEIIESTGSRCITRILNQEEKLHFLEKKLREELAEYLESGSLEELADLLEVMMAVAQAKGESWNTVEAIRDAKKAARGGFEKGILLLETE